MKLYHVKRTDLVSWDEYDAWIVRARNKRGAVLAVWDQHGPSEFSPAWALGHPASLDAFRENVTVTRVREDGAIAVILSDFKAG